MLNPRNELYKSVLDLGLGQKDEIDKAVDAICEEGIDKVFLVGCGGSLAVMYPCQYILETETTIPAFAYNSSEFLNMGHKQLDDKSLVILSSYTGSTKETVAAAKMVKEFGAKTLGFMGKLGTPLAEATDYAFANAAEIGTTESKLIMLYMVIFRVMKNLGQMDDYDAVIKSLKAVPENLITIREKFEPRATKFAIDNKEVDYYMTLSSGITWVCAYSHAMCIIEEMQWIKARSVHSGEFFHGAFEIVTEDTHVLLYQGEDGTRPLGDRCKKFCNKYTNNLFVIDTKEYDMPGVAEEHRGFMSPLVINACQERMNKHLEFQRNHPLSKRRYMGIVEY